MKTNEAIKIIKNEFGDFSKELLVNIDISQVEDKITNLTNSLQKSIPDSKEYYKLQGGIENAKRVIQAYNFLLK